MPYSQIKLVSFDLDNTLYDNQPVIDLAEYKSKKYLQEEFKKQSQPFDYQKLIRIKKELVNFEQQGSSREKFQYENLSKLRKDALFEFCNQLNNYSEIIEKAFEIFINYRNKVDIDSLVVDLLEKISENYLMVSVTNGNCDVTKLEVGNLFSKNYSPVGGYRAKPHPQMLKQIFDDFTLKPQQVLHIGDRNDSDGLAAQKAGCYYYQLDPFIDGKLNQEVLIKFTQDLKIQ